MKYFFMLVAFGTIQLVYSQECQSTLFGRVIDFHNGTPIIDAVVFIKSLNKYSTTDNTGKFSFENLCDNTIYITVSHLACETKHLEINIKGNTFYEVNLEHHIEELSEVKIDGVGKSKSTQTSQETVLKTESIERYSAFSLGDALKQISGVSTINTGNAIVKPVINGLHSSRVVIITNGVRLQDQEWGIEHAPNIDLNSAGSINLIKGASALAYGGDAIGGVIILKPQAIRLQDSLYGKTLFSGQTNGRGYSLNSALTKTYKAGWFIDAQASLRRFGDFMSPNYSLTNTGLKSNGFSINSGYKTFEQGFNVYYSYLNTEVAILRSSHIGNIEDLINAINNKNPQIIEAFSYDINPPNQNVKHNIIKANFFKRFKKFGKLDLQYDFQNNHRFEYDIRRGDNNNKPAIDLNLKTHSLKTNLKVDSKNHQVVYEFGLHTIFQTNFPNPNTQVKRLIPDYERFDLGAFATSNLKLNTQTTLDFGLRYDFNTIDSKKFYETSRWIERGYSVDFENFVIADRGSQLLTNPVFDYHNISASAGIAYKLSDTNSFIVNYGLSNRAPNPSELFSDGLHHSAARIELGNLRTKQETSNRFSGTYQYQANLFSLNIETFYNRITNYIFIEPTGLEYTIRGAFPVWSYNQTNAALYGIDLNTNYALSEKWLITNKSSFIKGRDLNNKQALIDMPSFKTVTVLDYTNKNWLDFKSNITSELILRQTNFPNNNFDVFIPTTQELVEVDISSTPPTYHLLHFQSEIALNLTTNTKLTIGFNVTNLLNTPYRENLNRLRYFADDLGRNFMLQLKLNY